MFLALIFEYSLISRKIGRVLYETQRLNGTVVVAHANQLRRRMECEDVDPLSVLIESFDIGRNDTIIVNRPSPPTSPMRPTTEFNDVRRSPPVPRFVPTKVVENDKKTIVIEPTKDVENDKKNKPHSTVVDPIRPKRDRKFPNRLNVSTTKGQSYSH